MAHGGHREKGFRWVWCRKAPLSGASRHAGVLLCLGIAFVCQTVAGPIFGRQAPSKSGSTKREREI